MRVAESMRTGAQVPVEGYAEFKKAARRHDFLVCPWCGWEVRHYAAGGNNMAHFRHLGLKGDALYKRCTKYRAGQNPGGGGGDYQPTLEADDRQTLTEVLQGYVIGLLAAEQNHFKAEKHSYKIALRFRRHLRLMKEVNLADEIAGAAKTSGLSNRWTVCTAAFLRFALASASDDGATGPPSRWITDDEQAGRTPFRQILALAWSGVQEEMREELRNIVDQAPPYDTAVVEQERIDVLRSWFAFLHDREEVKPLAGKLTPGLACSMNEALRVVPIDKGARTPQRVITSMVIAAVLRIVEGLRIDRLIDNPSLLLPSAGYVYIGQIYWGAGQPVGVKVGYSADFPRREKAHRLALMGTVPELDFVRLVRRARDVEAVLKSEMARRFPVLRDVHGAPLGDERFACSLQEAERVARRVIRDLRATMRDPDEVQGEAAPFAG